MAIYIPLVDGQDIITDDANKVTTGFFEGGNVFPMLNVLSQHPLLAFKMLDLKTGNTVGFLGH